MENVNASALAVLAALASSVAAVASALAAVLSWREQRARNRWDARRDMSLRAETMTRYSEWTPDSEGLQSQTSAAVAVVTATNTGQRPVSVESIGIDFADSDTGGYYVSVDPPRRLDVGETVAVEIELRSLRAMLSGRKGASMKPKLRSFTAVSTNDERFRTAIVDYWRDFPDNFQVDERVSRVPR